MSAVTNLPYRATWDEGGRRHEGCYTVKDGLVLAYFDDRTVAILPLSVFTPTQRI